MNASEPAIDSSTWAAGTFARHTLIYALGDLGDAMIERAMNDTSVRDRCVKWARSSAGRSDNEAELLATCGAEGGVVELVARARPDEFCVRCQHERFEAIVALGYNVAAGVLRGVFVASFEGDEIVAGTFAAALARLVRQRTLPSSTDGCSFPISLQLHTPKTDQS